MSKKFFYVAALLAGLVFTGTSCADDKGDNDADDDDAIDLDYTASNANSWGNYMVNVASLLKKDAEDLYNYWYISYKGNESYATTFKNHNNATYSSASSCIQELIEGGMTIANEVGDAKIGDPYDLYMSGETKKALYAVESWYSWHSRDDYTNNIWSVRNAYYGSLDGSISEKSLSHLMSELDAALDAEVKKAIADAAAAIQAIPQPFRNHINSTEAQKAMTACLDLEAKLKTLNTTAQRFFNDGSHDAELDVIINNYVDDVVLPTYKSLKEKNAALYTAVLAFKNNPSNENFEAAGAAWLNAREPWEKSEAFLFGPVDAEGLDPNMDSWPLDQVAIVNTLKSGNFDDLNWGEGDDDDTVEAAQNVRGFHTLEFLLFKNGKPRTVN